MPILITASQKFCFGVTPVLGVLVLDTRAMSLPRTRHEVNDQALHSWRPTSSLQAVEQPDSGLLRTMIMQDQDPDLFFTLVVFESEEKARARERDPRLNLCLIPAPSRDLHEHA